LINIINMSQWIDREAALKALGVRPQTLYAYVSRGRIGMRPDPADPRRSLYRVDDITALTSRRARGRRPAAIAASAIAWGEPIIETAISTAHHGRLIYRGADAVELSHQDTLEQVAQRLWQREGAARFASAPSEHGGPFVALAALVADSRPILGRMPALLCEDGERVIGRLAGSLGADAGEGPIHERLVRGWSVDRSAGDAIRRALVLLADHELNASTFAVRVAASTGASIAASLLAGLGALSGPYHGGAGAAVMALVEEVWRSTPAAAVRAHLMRGQPLPGFGHQLYPEGDPRAAALLAALPEDGLMAELRRSAAEASGAPPNIDFALAALTITARLPMSAPFRLFAIGRSVGWVAHAIEQATTGALIRPRAHYRGEIPAGGGESDRP
jgi:citrate synthase